mgnify:CR=1 FL=1
MEVGFSLTPVGKPVLANIESRVETMHREQDLSTPTRPAQGFPQPGFVSKTDKTDRHFRNGASRRVCYGSGCLEDAKTLKTDDRTQAPSKTDKTYNSFSHHRFFRIYRREGPRTEPHRNPQVWRSARRAGVEKTITPLLFRHSRITAMMRQGYSESACVRSSVFSVFASLRHMGTYRGKQIAPFRKCLSV